MIYNNLPLFELSFSDDVKGISYISFVERPAIKSLFLSFSEDDNKESVNKFYFSDAEKRIVSGAALIPDLPILRRNKEGNPYYVVFRKDDIEKFVQKFFNDQKTLAFNIEHSKNADDVVIIESYFLDKERGINPAEFSELPNGTWIISVKVNNENLWNEIKDGKYKGFSVEGFFDMKFEEVKDNENDPLTEMMEYVINLF